MSDLELNICHNFINITYGGLRLHLNKKIYIETYGCQMNFADTEIVRSILNSAKYELIETMYDADIILVNTCAVRENAEERIWGRLGKFKTLKESKPNLIIGVLGCIAERLGNKLVDNYEFIDLVVGPDEYRNLPFHLESKKNGDRIIAIELSKTETYSDIIPLRKNKISSWIPIMRGCNNYCSYCVVPYTRGRERSRALTSILKEVEQLSQCGYKEITLLGQNVNSYFDDGQDFADLLNQVANIDRKLRIRFITSHPKDMSDKLIHTIALNKNICKHIHLPLQSGSDRILDLMNRNYSNAYYKNLVKKIRQEIPYISLTTDIIAGFPTETEDDHKQTLDLMNEIKFDSAFTFYYSPRENTKASQFPDDIPKDIKIKRLNEIIELQRKISYELNKTLIGKNMEVLVEDSSKRSNKNWCGRTDTNKMVIFPKNGERIGDYTNILIEDVNAATLFGVQTNSSIEY